MGALLKIEQLVISYGAIEAVKKIDIQVQQGQIVALLGANGAGKSSVLRSISGLVKVKSGWIHLDGHDLTNQPPYRIAASGVIASPEGRLILRGLTVEENLMVGAYSLKSKEVETINEKGERTVTVKKVKQRIAENLDRVYRYFPVLKERRKQQASTLSGGEQQMLAIGRALMASPKILLLDEPSLGLAPLIVRDIFEIIKQIRAEGTTILIVEQNAYQTLKIADYAYVMELGRIKAEGVGEELLKDETLVAAYLGESTKKK